MDIRIQKTKKNISTVFLELRSEKPLEKITIKELCQRAKINKSTFYSHYHDIYDLAEQMENNVIASVVDSITDLETIFSDPECFSMKLMLGYMSCGAVLRTLFSGTRTGELPRKMEWYVKKKLTELNPEILQSPFKNTVITYTIFGSYHAFMENRQYGDEPISTFISKLAKESLKYL